MPKHYGSTAVKYIDRQMIAWATCTCGWKSQDEICELDLVDNDYDERDCLAIIGALAEIELSKHLERVEDESSDD